jgi:uncharacterized protein YbjQ (UPF0145 family)
MLLTTTDNVKGYSVKAYHGIVVGEAVIGANIIRDLFAKLRDVVGGHTTAYEQVLRQAREDAQAEMMELAGEAGANAVIGVTFDYETLGKNNTIILVTAAGTAVTLSKPKKKN